MFEFLTSFLAKVAGRLSGIARATKSGLNVKDLHRDVWIAASGIGEKRGHPVNLQDPVDQELVLTRVYNQTRKHRDWRVHYAESLDAENEDGLRLSERIGQAVTTDPLAVLTRRATMIDQVNRLAGSHSQAAAYVTALRNFDDDKPSLSSRLAISVHALGSRMDKAFEVVNRQNSILDSFETIDDNFMPLAGRHFLAKGELDVEMAQSEMQF
jgi:hypothetical protein